MPRSQKNDDAGDAEEPNRECDDVADADAHAANEHATGRIGCGGDRDSEIRFLTLEEIEAIHADQLTRYGGLEGYRYKHLIESAVDTPKQTISGRLVYEDIADMASVYLFQIGESQGFTDGNKRTGAAACSTFLMMNGYELACSEQELYDVAMQVVSKQITRKGVAAWVRGRIAPAE